MYNYDAYMGENTENTQIIQQEEQMLNWFMHLHTAFDLRSKFTKKAGLSFWPL